MPEAFSFAVEVRGARRTRPGFCSGIWRIADPRLTLRVGRREAIGVQAPAALPVESELESRRQVADGPGSLRKCGV